MNTGSAQERNKTMKILQLLRNKKRTLSIAIPITIVVIYGMLTFGTNPRKIPVKSPDKKITLAPTMSVSISTKPTPQTNPPVKYNPQTSEKMLQKLKSRSPLSTLDRETKARILARINNKSSILREASTFRIEYIKSPDVFMVEIRTVDIGKGKADAKNWLMSQGFTAQGACELPVVYYLSSDAASRLRDLDITFSPLASGC